MSREQAEEEAHPPADQAPATGSQGLEATHRALRILMGVSIALPSAFFLYLLAASYWQARQDAFARVISLTDIVEEHARKTAETNQQLLARVLDTAGVRSNAELVANEAFLNRRLAAFAGDMPQLAGISIVAEEGTVIASSRTYPFPESINIADREDFQAIRQGAEKYVSGVLIGRINRQPIFNISVPRRYADGRFAGLVSVSLKPEYFANYYTKLASSYPGLVVTLSQRRGAILARYPAVPADPQQMDRLELGKGLAGSESQAALHKATVNGVEQYFAFRQVGDYPMYVSVRYATHIWVGQWLSYMFMVAAFTFIPTLGLLLALRAVQRRLRAEAAVLQQWQQEMETRALRENALRQVHRLEALGRLTGGVAHDFNNLLMVVSTSALVLRKRVTDPPLLPSLETLERVVESGRRLTRQLLAFARKQPLRPESIDLAEHMEDFAELLQASVGGRIALDIDIATNLPPVWIDGAELELALLNLALNAREAMPDGGELRISATRVDLPTGLHVCIHVRDTGHGIAAEDLDRVFEPFFSTRPGNTGMGLSQVYGFCEQAGGTVRIESARNVGTCVQLCLPVAETAHEAAHPDQALFSLPGGQALLVEDNEDVAKSSATLLEYLGYEVTVLTSADAAIALLAKDERQWDVLVSDVMMPGGLNGIDLALEVRILRPALPVLLVTGYAAKLDDAVAAGLHVLAKPYTLAMLAKALDTLLSAEGKRTEAVGPQLWQLP
ncbi:hybrid sensor histidine kinase/response regulator [Chitinimonas naiadis]